MFLLFFIILVCVVIYILKRIGLWNKLLEDSEKVVSYQDIKRNYKIKAILLIFGVVVVLVLSIFFLSKDVDYISILFYLSLPIIILMFISADMVSDYLTIQELQGNDIRTIKLILKVIAIFSLFISFFYGMVF